MGGQTQQQQAASSGSLLQASAAAPVAAPTSGAFSAEAAMGVIQAQSADPSPVYSDLRVDAHGEGAWKTAGTDFGCFYKDNSSNRSRRETGDDATPHGSGQRHWWGQAFESRAVLAQDTMLNYEKMVSRSSEINCWTEFVELLTADGCSVWV
eukprot:s10895_g2.t1